MVALATAVAWSWAAGAAYADTPPSNSTPPTITGVAQAGDQLTADPGTWDGDTPTFSYQWSDGQTGPTDTLSPGDVGQSVSVTVTATNAAGQMSATSEAVGPVLPAAPVVSTQPIITGAPQQGVTLSVSNGVWSADPNSNDPNSYTYAWEDCNSTGSSCTTISGATSSSYTSQASDVGSTIVAVVTATNLGGATPATSNLDGPVLPAAPVVSTPPVISGVPQQGVTLSVSNGVWSADPNSNDPNSYTYAWQDCNSTGSSCTTIAGATSNTYKVTAADIGSYVSVIETASNLGGTSPTTTNAVGPVVPAAPVVSKLPAISGVPQQGVTLTVSTGAWNNGPTGYTYTWQDCNSSATVCTPITGATSGSYTLQASDVGRYLTATVSASNLGGGTSATSAIVGRVLPLAPADSRAPGIGGTAQQGDTLTASPGQWTNNPTGYTYAWQDCDSTGSNCGTIAGATSNTYALTSADVGSYVSVTVTATNSGGSASVTSTSIGPVLPPAPVNTKAPAIAGTPEQGSTLSVGNGAWSNSPTSYGYAWEECSSGSCAPIPGATSSSYTLSAADIGSTIVCVVSANGLGGTTLASSKKTAGVVAAPTPPASQPTTTAVLASPTPAVTNQGVTLIATVTSATTGSTALWGAVTFADGGAAIGGCVNMPVTPSGQSATVACSTSFAASTAQLTAVFTPTAGSVLKGSASPADGLTVGPDSTVTSLDASSSVNVGSSTTYTASVAPPAARPGPVVPTGTIEFLDGGQPIGSCAGQPVTNGQATCMVTYTAAGEHDIAARYVGDANFTGSSSPTKPVSAAPVPVGVLGTITSTMQWAFYYTPSYTQVRNLVVNGAVSGATVLVKCHGRGCPFVHHVTVLTQHARCGKKTKGMCLASGSFVVTPGFLSHRLGVGSRITIEIIRPSWVGKYYSFTVRSRRGPRIQIGCLAPGGSVPGQGC